MKLWGFGKVHFQEDWMLKSGLLTGLAGSRRLGAEEWPLEQAWLEAEVWVLKSEWPNTGLAGSRRLDAEDWMLKRKS